MPGPDLSRAAWRKSSHSNGMGGSCVEIAVLARGAGGAGGAGGALAVAVRDSKDRGGPVLAFPASRWRAFTAAIKAHDLDLA